MGWGGEIEMNEMNDEVQGHRSIALHISWARKYKISYDFLLYATLDRSCSAYEMCSPT